MHTLPVPMSDRPKPRLTIVDTSSGPSGLSRYLELLWPSLSSAFSISVVGDPLGPYSTWCPDSFLPVPSRLRNAGGNQDGRGELQEPPGCERAFSGARSLWKRFTPDAVKRSLGILRNARVASNLAARTNPNVVYAPLCDADVMSLGAALVGCRSVATIHHAPDPNVDSGKLWLLRYALRRYARIIAVSQVVAQQWTSMFPAIRNKVTVIRNGMDVSPDSLVEKQDSSDQFLAVAAGRLTEIKGFDYLVEAARLVCDVEPTFRLSIAGDGPLHGPLQEQIRRLRLERNVELVGHVSDMTAFYRSADVFVLSSNSEAMPFVVLEAMAQGLPVVATSVGGVPEIVHDGVSGRLVSPRDPAQLAEAILDLIRDRQKRQRLGLAAREFVATQCSVSAMQEQTMAVVRGASGQRAARRMLQSA